MVGPCQPVELAVDDQLRVDVVCGLKEQGVDHEPVSALEGHRIGRRPRLSEETDFGREVAQPALDPGLLGNLIVSWALMLWSATEISLPSGVCHDTEMYGSTSV